jgi:predicted dehydrogenase
LEREFDLRSTFDLDEALAERPDFALITNPTSMHMPVALEAAKHGCHLFLEKPLSDSLLGVDELADTVAAQGTIGFVAYNMRFHPALRQVKEMIENGSVGRVLSIRAQVGQYLPDWHPEEDYRLGYSAQRALGGGVILDLIHELDYVQWMVGDVRKVACFARHVSPLEIDIEDVAEIILDFESGAVGNVHLDYLQRPAGRGCRIIGEEGTILWDQESNEVRLFDAREPGWQIFRHEGFERNQMFVAEMEHFLACLEGRETPEVDVGEGWKSLKLALAAWESAETGQVIDL